jgi:hypothetical protein
MFNIFNVLRKSILKTTFDCKEKNLIVKKSVGFCVVKSELTHIYVKARFDFNFYKVSFNAPSAHFFGERCKKI